MQNFYNIIFWTKSELDVCIANVKCVISKLDVIEKKKISEVMFTVKTFLFSFIVKMGLSVIVF